MFSTDMDLTDTDWNDRWRAQCAQISRDYADLLAFQHPIFLAQGTCGPHCDRLVLHSPGANCGYCNHYPEIQAFRLEHHIAYSDTDTTTMPADWRPCPATVMRDFATINRWPGNRPQSEGPQHE